MNILLKDLLQLDTNLFLRLNRLHSNELDAIILFLSNGLTWVPLYLFLAMMVFKSYGKRGWAILAIIISATLIAIGITSGIMKPYFMRIRPCAEPVLQGLVHQILDCENSFSFASTQASASFALAVSFFILFKTRFRWAGLLLLWAGLVSSCRIFAGLHYPGDILVGALVGTMTGVICISLIKFISHKFLPNIGKDWM